MLLLIILDKDHQHQNKHQILYSCFQGRKYEIIVTKNPSIRANTNALCYAKAENVSVLQTALQSQDNLQLTLAFFCPFNAMLDLNTTLEACRKDHALRNS